MNVRSLHGAPSRKFVFKQTTELTERETFGYRWGNSTHFRGADGPRGGARLVCGRRTPAGAVAGRIASSEQISRAGVGRYSVIGYARLCNDCARLYMEEQLYA